MKILYFTVLIILKKIQKMSNNLGVNVFIYVYRVILWKIFMNLSIETLTTVARTAEKAIADISHVTPPVAETGLKMAPGLTSDVVQLTSKAEALKFKPERKTLLGCLRKIFSKSNVPKITQISENSFCKEIGNLSIICNQKGCTENVVTLKKPLGLFKGLKTLTELNQVTNVYNADKGLLESFAAEVKKTGLYKNRKLKGIVGAGSRSVALELDNAEILKISLVRDNCTARPYNELFDLPILDRGKVGNIWYYTQPKAETKGITSEHVVDIINKIKSCNYTPRDLQPQRVEQVGLYKGKPYLLDRECAR